MSGQTGGNDQGRKFAAAADAPRSGYAPYTQRVAPCGCRSVPDGIHLPGCVYYSPLPIRERRKQIAEAAQGKIVRLRKKDAG